MARLYVKEIALLLVGWIAFVQIRNWFRWRAVKKWGAQRGCGDLPAVKNKLPGGLERYSILFTGLKNIDFLEDLIRARYREIGCYTYRMFNLFNDSLISTSDPLNVQAVLGTQFHDFDLGNDRKFNFGDVLGNGIFTADGAAWTHYRAQLKPQFTRDQVSDLEAAERHLQILFKALPEENAAGWIERVNIMPLLYRFTMDVSTEFLFGRSVNSQSNALYSDDSGNSTEANEEKAFADAMEFAQSYIAWRTRLRGLYWLASSKEFKKACKTIKDFVDKIVATALNDRDRKHAVSTGQKEKYVLMDALVAETDNAVEIRDQTLHILLAGRDTTSALLSWMLLLLSRHPDELQKVRSAILTHFGTEKDPKNEPTFSSLKACKEVQNVIWETLRMYPLVPINGRVALKDTTLPTGGGPDGKQPVVVKKGELVGYSAYVMQRRHDIWGSNADEFVPSRWEGRKLGWEMIAFSGGPRICLGQQYALNEASFVLVKILQRYDDIQCLDQGPVTKGIATLILTPAKGVNIRMHRSSD